jgi:thioredoxin-related protein
MSWLLVGFGSALAMSPEAIPWRSDFRLAEAEARAQDRLLWIQFTGAWCPNCVLLEREAFVHPQVVGQARQSFVPVKLQSENHQDLVERYGITGIPATILVTPRGEVVARNEGYVDTARFHAFLEDALNRSGRSPRAKSSRPLPAPVGGRARPVTETAAVSTGVTPSAAHAPGAPKVGLEGFCPVSLVEERRMVYGQRTLTLSRDGLVYCFVDAQMRQRFEKWPGRFLPVNGGRCPVAQVDQGEIRPGEARWCVLFKDHLFLCSDEEGRSRFLKNPERYAHVAMADRTLCPHCWGREGFPVQGVLGTSLAPEGWRSRPIDPIPSEARRSSSETLRR